MKKLTSISSILLCVLSMQVNANMGAAQVQFNQTRFLFTEKQRTQSLEMTNMGNAKADCKLGFVHYNQQNGEGVIEVEKQQAIAPASHLLRFSPRSVSIPKDRSQTARLVFRRRPNLQEGDYLSYIRMQCVQEAILGQQNALAATVNFNIPVYVRIGDPKGSVKIESAHIDKQSKVASIRVSREGSRAWVGSLTVTDSSGEEVARLKNVTLSQAVTFRDFKLPLKDISSNQFIVTYQEDKEFGKTAINYNVKL